MTTIETNGRQIVVVEVPEGARDFFIGARSGLIKYCKPTHGVIGNDKGFIMFDEPKNYTIIGLISDLTAEQLYSLFDVKLVTDESFESQIAKLHNLDTTKPLLIIEKLK